MIIMKNNFGVEPDVDSVVTNAAEGSSGGGHPKAILICRKNSHPFQARTLILTTPAKIGRSVALARPSSNNGIFDCKVLSRNHAIIWYEYDTGKFMIQDTKSSNGTFVNNQRLSKGGETSLPREFFNKDIVQFGVDVLENQRKGNEDSENSDESNHIVAHGCIVATVRLFHPNGKESKSCQPYCPPNPMNIPQEKICKLELIIHEAQQREERLHDKLEELHLIISKLESACQEALTNRFEETRLLSKIESLEKQIKVMSKIMSGEGGKTDKVENEIQQLLADIEKVQNVAKEIQERQHRKLLESEQKLVEAQRVASNLELEVIALREQASLTDSQLQYMGAKYTAYCQQMETFKNNFCAQLEAQVAKFVEREVERELNDTNLSELSPKDKYRFILDESDKDVPKKETLWRKNYEEIKKIEEKECINEDDGAEWFTRKLEILGDAMSSGLDHISNRIGLLVNSLINIEKSRRNLEKLCKKKHELAFQLDSAKMPVGENDKTEDELGGEKNELVKNIFILSPLSNEKITELENELKEQEELLRKERASHNDLEAKCGNLKGELYVIIRHCKELSSKSSNLKTLLKNYINSLEEAKSEYKQKLVQLESEIIQQDKGQELKAAEILWTENKNEKVEEKETQTLSVVYTTSSTNTELEDVNAEILKPLKENNSEADGNTTDEKKLDVDEPSIVPAIDMTDNPRPLVSSTKPFELEQSIETKNCEIREKFLEEQIKPEGNWISQNFGLWGKMQKIQHFLSDQPSKESPLSDAQFLEMKNLMNLIAEDIVHLLLREQQMSKDKQSLQEKLDKSMSGSDISNFGLAIHLKAIMLFLVTAIIAYFLYSTAS